MSDDVRDPNGQSASDPGRLGNGGEKHDDRVTDHLPVPSGNSQNGKDAREVPPSDTAGLDAASQPPKSHFLIRREDATWRVRTSPVGCERRTSSGVVVTDSAANAGLLS